MSILTSIGNLIGQITGGSGGTASGQPYSTIYAFGDSLSDAGNLATLTAGLIPVAPPYAGGEFSNGPVWAQDLATDLGLSTAIRPSLQGGTDFAYGGATTGSTPDHQANPLDLPSQLAQFELQDPVPSPNALYTVWAGSNDIFDALANGTNEMATVDAAVSNEMQFIDGLVAHGANNLLVMFVPDIGQTPDARASGPAYQATATQLSTAYDAQLAQNLWQLEASDPSLHLTVFNTAALLDQAIADPSAFGFTNVTAPLWDGNFENPNSGALATTDPQAQAGYLFFDGEHPTAQAHAILASAVAQALTGTA
jgi:phospholipase/lecithinase/hemolysin